MQKDEPKEDRYLKIQTRSGFTIEELEDIERRAIGEQNDYPNILNPKLTRAYGELGHWAGKVIKQLRKETE